MEKATTNKIIFSRDKWMSRVFASGLRRVTYKVPSLGTVCRGAFMKCYGFSHRKIKVLLRKMDNDGFSVQQDMRGKHEYNVT